VKISRRKRNVGYALNRRDAAVNNQYAPIRRTGRD